MKHHNVHSPRIPPPFFFFTKKVVNVQELLEPENWSYYNTKNNSADLVTHGISTKAFIDSYLWFRGYKLLTEVNSEGNAIYQDVDIRHIIEEKMKTPEKKCNLIFL